MLCSNGFVIGIATELLVLKASLKASFSTCGHAMNMQYMLDQMVADNCGLTAHVLHCLRENQLSIYTAAPGLRLPTLLSGILSTFSRKGTKISILAVSVLFFK